MPEDRVRLLANGAVIGIGAVAAGLALETLVALTRPAGVLSWSDLPVVVGMLAVATCVTLVAALAAAAAAFRSSLLAALPGTEISGRRALPTLVDDVVELVPPARRPLAALFSRPAVLVGLVALVAFAAVVVSQPASPAFPTLALGLLEATAIVVGYLVLGRPLGLRGGRAH